MTQADLDRAIAHLQDGVHSLGNRVNGLIGKIDEQAQFATHLDAQHETVLREMVGIRRELADVRQAMDALTTELTDIRQENAVRWER